MSPKTDNSNPFDPTGMIKSVRDSGIDTWSKMMIQLVNTEAYAQASGAMMDAWLTTSAPFRKAVETTMTQVLTQLNMPTRGDITSMAERLTNIELRLDDMEAKIDEVQHATRKPAVAAKPKEPKESV